MKICVLFDKYNILSLNSTRFIYNNYTDLYDINYINISKDNMFYLIDNPYLINNNKIIDNLYQLKKYDLIIPLINKPILNFLNILNIKHTGDIKSNILECDFMLFKDLMKLYKIKQSKYVVIYKESKYKEVKKNIKHRIKYPCNIKDIRNNIIYKVNKEEDLKKMLEKSFRYEDILILDHFIKGKKIDVYIVGDNIYNCYNKKIYKITKKICNKLNIKDYLKITYIISKNNKIYIDSINTIIDFEKINMHISLMSDSKVNIIDKLIKIDKNS